MLRSKLRSKNKDSMVTLPFLELHKGILGFAKCFTKAARHHHSYQECKNASSLTIVTVALAAESCWYSC